MTKLPWVVAAEELFTLRGHGGQVFADFVSALLRAEGAASGVRPDDIQTNTRVNLPDGGVDAEVKAPLGGPLTLAVPTCWQFKATQFSAVNAASLTVEANKSEAKRLIELGYGYFVCVCDDAPPEKMTALDKALLGIVRTINPDAPVPRVLNVGHLADWASRHPGIVLQFFRQHLGQALAYEPWLKKERAILPTFVELAARDDATQRIRNHVSANRPARGVLSIRGPSGSGVSRLVAESLSSVAPRVIYVPDASVAVELVTSLLNQPTATGILVLDRCGAEVRMAVEALLAAESSRLRVVAIQDATQPSMDVSISLGKLDDSDAQRVIDANFNGIASSHRRAIVQFADGVLTIAVRLATAYLADRPRFLLDSAAWAHDELRRLVRDERDRETLKALSLFSRVGYNGDVAAQLDTVSRVFNLPRKEILQRLRRLSQAPGVVLLGSRYVSVRPRLFARPLFEAAWAEAVGDNVNAFVEELPPDLVLPFLKQTALHAPKAARDAVADWAMPWARGLKAAELQSSNTVERLIAFVEVSPSRMGPILSDLVKRTSDEEARAAGERVDSWPSRARVIWALRDLLERKDTHGLAESALFRLARVEEAPREGVRNGTSATETWAASFRLFLSGTEVAFKDRLTLLTARLEATGCNGVPLVVVALGYALDSYASRTEGAPIASGDVRRADWHPSTYGEVWECLDAAIALLARCMSDTTHAAVARKCFVRHVRSLLQNGRLDALRTAAESVPLDEGERVAVLGALDDFIGFDTQREQGEETSDSYPVEYVERVKTWHQSLKRADLSGRLLEAIAAPGYRRQVDDRDAWLAELDDLAGQLFDTTAELERLLPVLVSDEHHGGALFEIGRSIGQRDSEGALLSSIFACAVGAKNPLFIRGYVTGLAEHGVANDAALEREIDRLEERNPEMAVDLNGMNRRIGSAGARAIRLVRAGRLPARSLTGVWSLRFEGELLADSLETILATMVDRPDEAAATALEILGPLAWDAKSVLPNDERTLLAIWCVLETALDGARGEAHAWGRVLRRLSEHDLERAVRLASSAVVNGDFSIQEEAARELSVYIGKNPTLALSTLGPMLLDPKNSWRVLMGSRGAALLSFPVDALIQWIDENGVAAARVVAHQMPTPYIEAAGNPTVPRLTAHVLENFESDDRVFSSFCSSRHTGLYSGDIAAQHEKEAAVAEQFRSHPVRRVREWADREAEWARKDAQRWREYDEEQFDD